MTLVAVVWAVCMLASVVALLVTVVRLHRAVIADSPERLRKAKAAALWVGGELMALSGFALVLGVAVNVAGL